MFAPSRLQSGACTGKAGIREFLKGYRSFDDLIFCSQLHLDIEAGATQAAVPKTRLDPVENLYHQGAVKALELLGRLRILQHSRGDLCSRVGPDEI
jgi:hypothetical protein